MYRIAIDREACDGVFACLVRDERFVEGEEGLAAFDPASAESVERNSGEVAATFADDRIEAAKGAAAACPLDAITVEELDR